MAAAATCFWGDSPDEDGYFVAHGVCGTRSLYTSPRGVSLFTRSWLPARSSLRAVVCMVHGYGNDISWTFQSTAVFLARSGFACFALDLPGHGHSEGLRAFVPDIDFVADDCLAFFHSPVVNRDDLRALPRFLYGESMGGSLCLLMHLRWQGSHHSRAWASTVLVAPMCKISEKIRPQWPVPHILTFLARFSPMLIVVPTADLVDKSVKVPEKRAVAGRNPLRYVGKPRLGTVVELLRVTDYIHSRLPEVTIPFVVLHGSANVVTDLSVSQALYETAGSGDKTICICEGMMHSLLFGEPDENIAIVRAHILSWLNDRCRGGGGPPADGDGDGQQPLPPPPGPVHGSLIQYGQLFRYSPYKGFFGNDSFSYTISDVNKNIDTGTVFISVLCKPPQFVSLPVQLQVIEDVISPKFGGFSGFTIKHSDKLENISVTLKAQYGSIFLAPMSSQLSLVSGCEMAVTRGGRTGEELIIAGIVEVVNSVLQLIQYLGKENFYGNDVISLYAMNRNGIQDAYVPVNVEPVNDPPFIHVPKFIMLKESVEGFQIFDKQMYSIWSLIGDADLDNFPGNKSNFVVTLSLQLNDGILISSLPDHLIRTVELKIKNSHQWQHLQTFVTISNYFVIKGKGIRIRASIDDCNNAMQKLLYQGSGHGAVLTISVNDMGNHGCYMDCAERISLPLYTEVAVNLIKKRPINSISARLVGAAIIIEFITMLLLGGVLLFFICKCTNVLYKERTTHAATSAIVDNHIEPTTSMPRSDSSTYFMQQSSHISLGSNLRQRSLRKPTSEGTSKNKCPSSSLFPTANHQQNPSSGFSPFSIERPIRNA